MFSPVSHEEPSPHTSHTGSNTSLSSTAAFSVGSGHTPDDFLQGFGCKISDGKITVSVGNPPQRETLGGDPSEELLSKIWLTAEAAGGGSEDFKTAFARSCLEMKEIQGCKPKTAHFLQQFGFKFGGENIGLDSLVHGDENLPGSKIFGPLCEDWRHIPNRYSCNQLLGEHELEQQEVDTPEIQAQNNITDGHVLWYDAKCYHYHFKGLSVGEGEGQYKWTPPGYCYQVPAERVDNCSIHHIKNHSHLHVHGHKQEHHYHDYLKEAFCRDPSHFGHLRGEGDYFYTEDYDNNYEDDEYDDTGEEVTSHHRIARDVSNSNPTDNATQTENSTTQAPTTLNTTQAANISTTITAPTTEASTTNTTEANATSTTPTVTQTRNISTTTIAPTTEASTTNSTEANATSTTPTASTTLSQNISTTSTALPSTTTIAGNATTSPISNVTKVPTTTEKPFVYPYSPMDTGTHAVSNATVLAFQTIFSLFPTILNEAGNLSGCQTSKLEKVRAAMKIAAALALTASPAISLAGGTVAAGSTLSAVGTSLMVAQTPFMVKDAAYFVRDQLKSFRGHGGEASMYARDNTKVDTEAGLLKQLGRIGTQAIWTAIHITDAVYQVHVAPTSMRLALMLPTIFGITVKDHQPFRGYSFGNSVLKDALPGDFKMAFLLHKYASICKEGVTEGLTRLLTKTETRWMNNLAGANKTSDSAEVQFWFLFLDACCVEGGFSHKDIDAAKECLFKIYQYQRMDCDVPESPEHIESEDLRMILKEIQRVRKMDKSYLCNQKGMFMSSNMYNRGISVVMKTLAQRENVFYPAEESQPLTEGDGDMELRELRGRAVASASANV